MQKILLVDDSKESSLILREVFDEEYSLVCAFNIEQASLMLSKNKIDLVLLDVGLPDGDGFEFCARLRSQKETKDIPVIFLTGKSDLAAKTIGFSLGAEDYIVKPFDALEVKLRCISRLKKLEFKKSKESTLQYGDLRFEIASQRVYLITEPQEEKLDLTPTGFKLLLYLAQNKDLVFTRDQLINAVWGSGTYIVDRTVDTHVGALRKKLTDSQVEIQSVHGHGYKMTLRDKGLNKKSAA